MNNFDKIKLEIYESFDNGNISNYEKDILMEKLETTLLDKKKPSETMTLYHVSAMDLDVIKPKSINIGTRLSKTRMSSFWTKNKKDAYMWAALRYIMLSGIEYTASIDDRKIYMCPYMKTDDNRKYLDVLKETFNKYQSYLYTLNNVKVSKIGRGQCNIGEYTLDEDVKPSKKEIMNFSRIQSFYIPIHEEEFWNLYEKHGGRGTHSKMNSSILEKLIYKNGQKVLDKRGKMYKNAISKGSKAINNPKTCEQDGYYDINFKEAKKGYRKVKL